jgi:hypothetical protein
MFHGGDGHQYAEDEWDRRHEADQNKWPETTNATQ